MEQVKAREEARPANREPVPQEILEKDVLKGLAMIKDAGDRISLFGHLFKVIKVDRGGKVVIRYEDKKITSKGG